MPMRDRIRLRVAQEAARIMSEQGIREHDLARRKAAHRLGVTANRSSPRDDEIDAALLEYQRIYRPQAHADNLAHLRKLASEAMRFLAAFDPLLTGGVWDGSANRFTPIILHLFVEAPEDVARKLRTANIPFEDDEHAPLIDEGRSAKQPAFTFYADGTRIELLLFPPHWKGRSVRKKGGKRPGGSLEDVLQLLNPREE